MALASIASLFHILIEQFLLLRKYGKEYMDYYKRTKDTKPFKVAGYTVCRDSFIKLQIQDRLFAGKVLGLENDIMIIYTDKDSIIGIKYEKIQKDQVICLNPPKRNKMYFAQ